MSLAVLALLLAAAPPAEAGSAPCPELAPALREARSLLLAQRGEAPPMGTAENALGTLVVRRADGRVERLRGPGALALHAGDECRTEKGSRALIRLADGTRLAMNEETTFTLRAREERGRTVTRVIRLAVGELWLRIVRAGPVEVETPAATAAIKGTELNVRVGPDGRTLVTVVDGTVVLRNEWCSPCTVGTGRQSGGEPGRPCTAPVAADPAAATAWITGLVH